MAEKEERIICRVIEKGYACDYCFSRPAHKYYQCSISNNDCTYDVCKQCSLGMTRQEAIERIAKAICAGDCENCSDSPMGGPDCIKWLEDCGKMAKAESALNSLLGDK